MIDKTHELLVSTREFQDALRAGFHALASANCREVWLSDRDFAAWPLNEPRVIDHLTAWALSHRKLTVLAVGFEEVVRQHPRWVTWRQHWAHIVDCRAADEADVNDVPSLFIAPGIGAIRLSASGPHGRGSVSRSEADIVLARDQLDAVLQRSQEAFPSTLLGL
jgi:hypothetical protein